MAKRRGKNKDNRQKKSASYLVLGVGVLVVGLIALGMTQVLDIGPAQSAHQTALQTEATNLQSTSLENAHQVNAAPDNSLETDGVETVVDREIRYLGPPSDPATMTLAEAGDMEQPTLVWFHADWCHVCQQIKPDMVDLGEEYDGKVKVVRLNIDYAENRATVQRYGVRATPTFVLFDADGQIRGNVPGWPGYDTFTNAFDELLSEG